MSESSDVRAIRQRAEPLLQQIREWTAEDNDQGYDTAIGIVCEAETVIEALVARLSLLEAQQTAQTWQIQPVINELNEALQAGAFFNPEMFGSMLKAGDNPFLRWRDQLCAAVPPAPASQEPTP